MGRVVTEQKRRWYNYTPGTGFELESIETTPTGATAATTTVDYGYDAAGRMNVHQLNTGGTWQNQEIYGYDDDNNIVTEDTRRSGQPRQFNTYAYDGDGRLTDWEQHTSAGTKLRDEHYDYDSAGNRTHITYDAGPHNGQTHTWTYDKRNRVTTGPEGTYTWTEQGTLAAITNPAGTGTDIYNFDSLGAMVHVGTAEGVSIGYEYDGAGRLHERSTAGTVTEQFLYTAHGRDPIDDGATQYGLGPAGQLHSLDNGDGGRLALTDTHHDLVALIDPDTGLATKTISYDPWGKIDRDAGTDTDPNIGYQSDWTDPDTGDINMGARWYTPTSATFRSRDTYAGQLSTPISLNRYTYAANNPNKYLDPTGYAFCELDCGGTSYIAPRTQTSSVRSYVNASGGISRTHIGNYRVQTYFDGAGAPVGSNLFDNPGQSPSMRAPSSGCLHGTGAYGFCNDAPSTASGPAGAEPADSASTLRAVAVHAEAERDTILATPSSTRDLDRIGVLNNRIDRWLTAEFPEAYADDISNLDIAKAGFRFLVFDERSCRSNDGSGNLGLSGADVGCGLEVAFAVCFGPAKAVCKAAGKAGGVLRHTDEVVGSLPSGLADDIAGATSKIQNDMARRGWTPQMVDDALTTGQSFPATNKLGGVNTPATRYVDPTTGQSIVVDNATGEIVHVGGPGFRYD